MKKATLLIILLIIGAGMAAEDYLDLNFFIEPKFEPIDLNMVNFLIKNIESDSIRQCHVFAGDILAGSQPDSLILYFLNTLQPDIAAPIDYLFANKDVHCNLLMSNVLCDSVPILDRFIVKTDSIKVGIISAYNPDWAVKNDLPEEVKLDFKVFDRTRQLARELAPDTDFIVLLSNMTKTIDADLIDTLPIDVVVSFDYQKKDNGRMNRGKSSFYSILTNKGKYGKLHLKMHKHRLSYEWREVDFRVKP
ncbi:MAG TPA: hypothetical protein PLD62_09465 [Candidatus Cloacimonadota bacterium]|nr:hypothetical protein [Candidatus Cloacimonadota bacterium]